ncbi:condensation domain-containing protein, partial [Thermoflavimicrobium dichotomicum]
LLSDFNTLYQQEENKLPAKSSSYQAWATKLKEYAMSPTFRKKERPYWEAIAESHVAPLPKDQAVDQGTFGDRKTITVSLTEEETQQLLTEAHRAYQTEINDLLLTALALTVKEWTGETRVALNLEGHGREEILEGIDLTRTVGWFTSIYPVLFELKTDDLSTAIKEVKETLRRVPNKGVGYGLLQYLSEEKIDFRLQPEMSFNYLGQFGQEGADQEIATLPMGHQISPRNHLTHVLDVNGIVMNNRLYLNFNFNRKAYESETIEQLANRYKQDLLAILSHCLQKEEQEQTPSDFSIKKLTVEELDDIFEAFEEEEIK